MDARDTAVDTLNKLVEWLKVEIDTAQHNMETAAWQDHVSAEIEAYSRKDALQDVLHLVQPPSDDGDGIPF